MRTNDFPISREDWDRAAEFTTESTGDASEYDLWVGLVLDPPTDMPPLMLAITNSGEIFAFTGTVSDLQADFYNIATKYNEWMGDI